MRATWRPLSQWPYPKLDERKSGFAVTWLRALAYLEREIEFTGGTDPIIGVVATDNQFTLAGTPKANFKVLYRGAEVGFDMPDGRHVSFHTDRFPTVQENIRAITLGLAALRAIERYGIAEAGEQFAGFAQLPSGGPDPAKGKVLAERAGGVRQTVMQHHPDRGGDPRDFADVIAYRDSIGAGS